MLADENDSSGHGLELMLSREDSFIDRGMKETSVSAHMGHTRFSLIFRRVALQKHDLQSTKCRLDILLSRTKFSITMLLVRHFCYDLNTFKLIFIAKWNSIDVVILYSVHWMYFTT